MFDRAPTFHVGAHTLGLRIFCTSAVTSWTQNNLCMAQLLLGLRIFQGADILPRAPTFQGADILHRAPTFCIGRRHFRAPTFCIGRRHFDVKYYFVYCRQEPIFNQFASLFCNKFLLDFLLLILCIFQYLFMHVVCANIFGAIVLKPRFKIDTV